MRVNTIILLLAAATIFVACDRESKVDASTFPKMQELTCDAGKTTSFAFTAKSAWRLSSDALWCKFITANGEQYDHSGATGTHTITLRITDELIKDEPTTANITMHIGDTERVVATVLRGAKELKLNIYDTNGKRLDAINIGYEEWNTFEVRANFRFAACDFPEWVEVEGGAIAGDSDHSATARVRIVPNGNRERYPITADEGYTMTFTDESGKHTIEHPIVFDGMGDDQITITGPTNQYYGWEISLEGDEFRQQTEEETYITPEEGLKYTITARNNEYELLYIEESIERGIRSYSLNADWMEFDPETMTLSVEPTDATRHGIVMALPMGIYSEVNNDLEASIFEVDDASGVMMPAIKSEYVPYILIEFTQRDFSERGAYEGMYIYHSLTTLEIEATATTDTTYSAEEAFEAPFINSVAGKRPGIIVDPRIEGWNTAAYETGSASAEVWYKGAKLKISEGEYYIGENKDEVLALHLWGPNAGFEENVYILFKVNGEAKKLLVVTPPTK